MPLKRIYLIPTVLAEETASQVLPPQVIEMIQKLDTFMVENVRTTRRFISSLKLGKVIDDLKFYDLTKDTPKADILKYFKEIKAEEAGIISEAGCPGIADPGAEAVKIAHEQGIEVIPLVGPSSILLALMASGFSGQSFVFHGYLPIEKQERIKAIRQMEADAAKKHQTQLFMETPYRNPALLEDLLQNAKGNTKLSIAADITAPNQLLRTLTINDWKKQKPDINKKPAIFGLFTE